MENKNEIKEASLERAEAERVKRHIRKYHKTSGVAVFDKKGQARIFVPDLPIDEFLDKTVENELEFPVILNWRPLTRSERRNVIRNR